MRKHLYTRPQAVDLCQRLKEPRQFMQVLSGARQVGKTTLAEQVAKRSGMPYIMESADKPTLQGENRWIEVQWENARQLIDKSKRKAVLLILDEVQKIPGWSETVKRLWDEDTRERRQIKVILLCSVPLLVGRGLTESLAGRFEILHLPHWSFSEMRDAFGWNLEQYIFYGAYPGAAPLIKKSRRWKNYILDSIVETAISRDVLLLTRVDKPKLLRQLFELVCAYSGQVLTYNNMTKLLPNAGNSITLARYLELLKGAGMLTGLPKYAEGAIRQKKSWPKTQVFNTALMTVHSGITKQEAIKDLTFWGRLTESAVGAHLVNADASRTIELFYWRAGIDEVDFVIQKGNKLQAIEVKSGHDPSPSRGLSVFCQKFNASKGLIVGAGGVSLDDFLSKPAEYWIE